MDFPLMGSKSYIPEDPTLFDWVDVPPRRSKPMRDSVIEHYPKTPTRSRTAYSALDLEHSRQRRYRYSHSAPAYISSSPVLEPLDATEVPPRRSSGSKMTSSGIQMSHKYDNSSHPDVEGDRESSGSADLREELLNAKHDIAELLAANQRLEEEKQDVLEKWGLAAEDMHKRQGDRNHNQDDRFFISEWGTLKYDIRNCAHLFFSKKPKTGLMSKMKGPRTDFLQNLTGDYSKYLVSDNHRPLIMQAVIWHYLCEEVFGTKKPVSVNKWAEPEGNWYQSLAQALRPVNYSTPSKTLTEYHRWRVNTASLVQGLAKSKEKKREFVNKLSEKIADALKHWTSGYLTNLKNYLEQIVSRAIDLDAEMQMQTAYFHVQTWRLTLVSDNGRGLLSGSATMRHLPFDPSRMEVFGEDSSLRRQHYPVSLIISPALVKAGNADGESYDVHAALAKATIVETGSLPQIRSASRASNTGRDRSPYRANANAPPKRSASAMSANTRKPDGTKVAKPTSPTSKDTENKPRWRPV